MTTHPATQTWDLVPFSQPDLTDTVFVWRFHLDVDDACHRQLSLLLTERERARANRLKIALRQRRWIVSRVMLRLITACAIGVKLKDLHFSHGPLGKPGLDRSRHDNDLCFNNTDSGDLGLVALAIGREVGVDLERLPRHTRAERITQRRFAAQEQSAILGVQGAQRNQRFLQCWTRKEAWGKAIGVGIRYPMRDVVLCDNLPEQYRAIEHDGGNWALQQLYPDSQSIACLVAQGRDYKIKTYALDNQYEALINAAS